MKKFLSLMVALTMLAGLTACGGGEKPAETPSKEVTEEAGTEEEAAVPTGDLAEYVFQEGVYSVKYPADKFEVYDMFSPGLKEIDDYGAITFFKSYESDLEPRRADYEEAKANYADFTEEEITVAGYPAIKYTTVDDYNSERLAVLVEYGENIEGAGAGILITVSEWKYIDHDVVMDIIESLTINK